ncbi:FUN14 domain-containing protein 1B-like isoform X2 [Macrosteles quadrilineatus]|uniref:FUN14 domain-containing protein 1B-like isoform X2 n=1 Tax=Macrosteles quadrilineatus TaxID=74068 RepID=UPI0023E0F811|nr:FUN14 domain-containing protein 1B-like isoform X2 [Macrosteles quadrilineatus]XP_054267702.1 FUN14 domain-containing protein 1B-like isoform X2 [Macrosteles quadrilineatus]
MTSPFNRKSKASKEEENSEITIQDVSKEAQSLIDKVIGDVGKTSATQQLILGTASGWLTGYLMMKVGKMAAVAVGGSIILLQVANHKGYVKINWDRIYRNVEDQVEKITEDASTSKKGPKILDKVTEFFKSNSYFSASFTGGVLIGVACS